jgi:uncharacterized membrane protein YhaH (DUF805 family)
MLNFVFGFNARLSRLRFFLASLALGFVMATLVFAIVMHAAHGTSHMRPVDIAYSWPSLIAIALFTYATFSLQSMRLRDIGWDPVCVIPGWIAFAVIDHLVATKFPALAIGKGDAQTAAGALVNLGLYLALMFWPSGEFSEPPRSNGPSLPPPPAPDRGTVSAARMRAVTGAAGGFGRRAA